MKIYIKCSQESEAYRSLIMKTLREAGHEVVYNAQVRNDSEGKAGCDLYMELSAGGLSHLRSTPATASVAVVSKVDFRIQKLVLVIGKTVQPRRAIVDGLHLKQKSRAIFINNYLKPAISGGLVTMTCPAHPNLPEQTYRLTAKGLDLYAELTKVPQ
jgi:hypothetical protein